MKNIFLMVGALLFSMPTPARPLSERTATYGAICGGVAFGALAGAIAYGYLNKAPMRPKVIIVGFVCVATGTITWLVLSSVLNRETPRVRFEETQRTVDGVARDPLVVGIFAQPQNLERHAIVRFGSDWPLIRCRDYLNTLFGNLTQAHNVAGSVRNEVLESGERRELIAACEQLFNRIGELQGVLEDRIALILSPALEQRYHRQLFLHARHTENELTRQTAARERERDRSHREQEARRNREEVARQRQLDRDHQAQQNELNRQTEAQREQRARNHRSEILSSGGNRPVIISV